MTQSDIKIVPYGDGYRIYVIAAFTTREKAECVAAAILKEASS